MNNYTLMNTFTKNRNVQSTDGTFMLNPLTPTVAK